MNSSKVRDIALAGLIAAVYVILTYVFLPISFGVYQVRVAEALTVLPFLIRAAIPGLYVGCLLSNCLGGMGWADILIGPLITLLAAVLTRLIRRKYGTSLRSMALAPLPPVILNAFGVSFYLAPLAGLDYWFSVQMIGVGEIVACYAIGLPLLILIEKRKIFV